MSLFLPPYWSENISYMFWIVLVYLNQSIKGYTGPTNQKSRILVFPITTPTLDCTNIDPNNYLIKGDRSLSIIKRAKNKGCNPLKSSTIKPSNCRHKHVKQYVQHHVSEGSPTIDLAKYSELLCRVKQNKNQRNYVWMCSWVSQTNHVRTNLLDLHILRNQTLHNSGRGQVAWNVGGEFV